MQKDERHHYSFSFARPGHSNGSNHRIEIPKKWLPAAAALFLTVASIGIFGFIKFDALTEVNAQTQTAAQQTSQPRRNSINEIRSFNYDRPASANINNGKIGGPNQDSYQLTNESDAEDNQTEAQLRAIEKTGNPEFLPSMWAHLGKINNEFGYRRNPFGGSSYEFHPGLDIDGEMGDAVIAPAKGVVVKAGAQGGYGNLIEVDHGNGLFTRYGHLSRIGVQIGDTIGRGQVIGLVGSTGRSTGPHLHFEIRLGDKAINPRRFLPPEMPN